MIIRSGALGAYVAKRGDSGFWIDAFWQECDLGKVVDVTGRSFVIVFLIIFSYQFTDRGWKCFLRRLVSWPVIDRWQYARRYYVFMPLGKYSYLVPAVLYASVASSFAIEQFGLPRLDTTTGTWNDDEPMRRLRALQVRHVAQVG